MNNVLTANWRVPSKEELKIIKRKDSKRFFNKIKNLLFYSILVIILIYLVTFASLSYKGNNGTENTLTLLILTGIILFVIIVFLVVYKLLYRHFYGVRQRIEEVTDNVRFLYHQMVSGVNDTDKLYAIVIQINNEQMQLLVDQRDYEIINESTRIFLGRFHDGTQYNYYIYY